MFRAANVDRAAHFEVGKIEAAVIAAEEFNRGNILLEKGRLVAEHSEMRVMHVLYIHALYYGHVYGKRAERKPARVRNVAQKVLVLRFGFVRIHIHVFAAQTVYIEHNEGVESVVCRKIFVNVNRSSV